MLFGHMTCGTLAPLSGIEPEAFSTIGSAVLTTGPLGKSQQSWLLEVIYSPISPTASALFFLKNLTLEKALNIP